MITDAFDRPLRDLRISVTDRCNFRCTYCMPTEIFGEKYQFMKNHQLLSFEEIVRLTRLIVQLGAVKLRLTGGEPLVRQEIEKLVAYLAEIQGVHDLAMTTNGVLLPPKAAMLRDAGLKRVTISLDTLDNDIFRRMNGGKADVEDVLKGIRAAEVAGFSPIKINAVVQRGVNDHTIVDLARFCKDNGYVLRFIEYMDVGTRNGWVMDDVVTADEIIQRIDAVLPIEPLPRQYASETSLRFRYRDGGGELGIIASVTKPFCGACSRLRMSPEGQLYTCLFATHGTDLKTPLRGGATDDELLDIIAHMWKKRSDRYSEVRSTQTTNDRDKIEMYYIGG